jgi:hypothetical protein
MVLLRVVAVPARSALCVVTAAAVGWEVFAFVFFKNKQTANRRRPAEPNSHETHAAHTQHTNKHQPPQWTTSLTTALALFLSPLFLFVWGCSLPSVHCFLSLC